MGKSSNRFTAEAEPADTVLVPDAAKTETEVPAVTDSFGTSAAATDAAPAEAVPEQMAEADAPPAITDSFGTPAAAPAVVATTDSTDKSGYALRLGEDGPYLGKSGAGWQWGYKSGAHVLETREAADTLAGEIQGAAVVEL